MAYPRPQQPNLVGAMHSRPVAFDILVKSGYLQKPKGYVSPYTPTNDPMQSVLNYQARLRAAGVEYPTEPKKTALFWRILDLLEHPRYAVVGFVKGLTEKRDEPTSLGDRLTNALRYTWTGFSGLEEHSVSDILESYGVKNKLILALGGFAGNLLLDPTTYVNPFQALHKAGVAAKYAPDIAEGLAKLGKSVPDIITKDVIDDVLIEAWKKSDDVIKQAAKSGAAMSSLSTRINAALGITDTSSDLAKKIVSTLEDVSWSRSTTAVQALRENLYNKLAKTVTSADELAEAAGIIKQMKPKSLAYANALTEQFGQGIKSINLLKGAETLAYTSGGKAMIKQFGVVEKAAREAADEVLRVTLANDLAGNFSKLTGRTWLTFRGKPLLETTVVKKGITSAANAAYKLAPQPVKKTIDVIRRMFSTSGWSYAKELSHVPVPGAESAQRLLGETVLPDFTREALGRLSAQTMKESKPLDLVKSFLQESQRLGRSLPTTTGLAVHDLLGPEVFKNPDLSRAVLHYADYLDVLERGIDDGGAALRAWQSIKSTLSPEDLELVMRTQEKIGMYMNQIAELDKLFLGSEYPARKHYLPRAYNLIKGVAEDDIGSRARQILQTRHLSDQVRAILQTRNYHELQRTIPSISWALENADLLREIGIEVVPDVRVAVASRIADTWKEVYKVLLDDSILSLVPSRVVSLAEKKGWIRSTVRVVEEGESVVKQVWLAPEVASIVNSMRNQFTNDLGLAQILDYFNNVTRHLKTLQITLNPAFHARNLIGEAFMNFTAGVTVESHMKAFDVIQRVLDNNYMQIGGQLYTPKDILRLFASTGLGFEGVSVEGMVRSVEDTIKRIAKEGKKFNPVALGRSMSDLTDSYFRLAHFIEGLDRGMTPRGAADWVRQFHVDYTDITMFEKSVMRTLFPYYTFTRKNIPMQIALFIDNPGIFTGIANLVESANRALRDPVASKFLESNFAIPIYDDGQNILYLNWNLPISDLGRIQTNWEDTIREFASMLHPLFRLPLEYAINRSLTTWQPITRPGEEWVPAFGEDSFKIPAQLRYAWSQLGAPWAVRQAIAGPEEHETEALTQPRQIPLLSSLLPRRSKHQMRVARAYELREELNKIAQRAQAKGIYVPSTQELQRRRKIRRYPVVWK